jgi:hypothetical protein
MPPHFEFGLDTFLPVAVDGSGLPVTGDEVIRNAVDEAVLAEAVGIDSFNIGESTATSTRSRSWMHSVDAGWTSIAGPKAAQRHGF